MPARSENPFLEDLAGLDALKVLRALKDAALSMHRNMVEDLLADMDTVSRDEFEAMRDIALQARGENEKLARRVAALEAKLGIPVASVPQKRKTKRISVRRRKKTRSKKP